MKLLAVTVALVLGLGATAPIAAQEPPPPGIGIRLLEVPAAREDDPRARAYVIDHVAPGTRFTRRFQVSNGTGRRVTVELYVAAAELRAGAFDILPGRAANELTGWSTVSPRQLTLAPGARGQATLSVAVPADASRGERYAAVVAELPPPPSATGVTVGSRVGIRMYLSVGRGGEPATDFAIESLTARRQADGRPGIVARVRNTGGRAIDANGELRLEGGPGGLSAGPFPVGLSTSLRVGAVGTVEVTLDEQVPAGPWDARLVLRSGTVAREAGARLTFPSDPGTSSAASRASRIGGGGGDDGGGGASGEADDKDTGVVLGVLGGGVLLLAVVALLVLLMLLERRRQSGLSRR